MSAALYLAGPLGFTIPTRAFHEDVLVPAVRAAGFEPLDPWTGTEIADALALPDSPDGPDRTARLAEANRATAARNVALLEACDGVLAVLDGTDVDSGTAAEIGYAAARGKPVVGWRSDVRQTGDNEATTVNLQVEHFLSAPVQRDLHDALALLRTLLAD